MRSGSGGLRSSQAPPAWNTTSSGVSVDTQIPPTKSPGAHAPVGSKRAFTLRSSARWTGSTGPQGSTASRTAAGASSTVTGQRRERAAQLADPRDGGRVVEPVQAQPGQPVAGAADERRLRGPRGLEHAPQAGRSRRDPDDDALGRALALALALPEPLVALVDRRAQTSAGEERQGLGDPVARGLAREPDEDGAALRVPPHVERVGLERLPRHGGRGAREPLRVLARADRGRGAARPRVQTQRDLRDEPERPVGAGEELGEVVAGDVLDDRAARARDAAVAQRELHADDEVARREVAVAQRPGVRRWRRGRRSSRRRPAGRARASGPRRRARAGAARRARRARRSR